MNEDWEKQFEFLFHKMLKETLFEIENDEEIVTLDSSDIKSFISNLLSTQRKEVIRRIEDMRHISNTNYNDLLADLKSGDI